MLQDVAMGCSWERVSFGSMDKRVTPLGLGSGYGLEARDVERAVERGLNFIYWGSQRRPSYAEAIRNLGPSRRENLVLVVQTYTRIASLMRGSLERALRDLRTDYTDLLLLGWWDQPPPRKIIDAAFALKEAGLMTALDRGPMSDEEMAWMRRVGGACAQDSQCAAVLEIGAARRRSGGLGQSVLAAGRALRVAPLVTVTMKVGKLARRNFVADA